MSRLQEIQRERQRLQKLSASLEEKLSQDWQQFRHSLRPINLLSQVIHQSLGKDQRSGAAVTLISDVVQTLVSRISKKLTTKVEEKIDHWLDKK